MKMRLILSLIYRPVDSSESNFSVWHQHNHHEPLLLTSFQLLSHVQLFVFLWLHALQHTRPPCPSLIRGACSNSCPLSRWCHPTVSSCCPFILLPSIFPSFKVFSNELVLCIRWPKYWSFSFNISPSNEHSGLISLGWTGWLSLQSKGLLSLLQHHSSKASILQCLVRAGFVDYHFRVFREFSKSFHM